MTWQKLSSVVKYKNRYMQVREEELITDHGEAVKYGIVHKKDAVIIIPWDGTKFTLIRQYRYPVDFDSWEFPAGHYEHESVLATAREELKEEAGLVAGEIKEIGTYHIAPGHLTQVCHIFLATDLQPGEQHLERSEKGMAVGQFTKQELGEMIKKGLIKDGLTIVSLKFFELLVQ